MSNSDAVARMPSSVVPRLLDDALVLLGLRAKIGGREIGLRHVAAESVEGDDVFVELAPARDDGGAKVFDPATGVVALGGDGDRPRFELGPGFLETLDFSGQRGRALDEPGVRRSGFGRPLAERLRRLARFKEPPLGRGQTLVGGLLIVFEPRDGQARLALPALDRLALFFGLAAFARQHLELLRDPRGFVGRLLQPRVVRDDGFFLLVMFGGERVDRARGLRDGRLEPFGLRQRCQRVPLHRDALARSLISRLVSRMPRDSWPMPPVTRRPRQTSPSRVTTGSVVDRLPPRVLGESAIHASPTAFMIAWRSRRLRGRRKRATRRRQARESVRLEAGRYARRITGNQEPAAAGIGVAHDAEARHRVFRVFDDDVLEQVRAAGVHGALVARFDLEVVGDGALLIHLAVGVGEDGAGRVAETGAGGVQLFEGGQPGRHPRKLVLARTHLAGAPLVFDAGAGQFGLAGLARNARGVERVLRALERVERRRPLAFHAIGLGADVVELDIQLDSVSATRSLAAPACSSACRSAVAELSAEKTSLRAASTSASRPSMLRCAAS